ncbi:MAG: addiction module protein [Syntrophobacteraceae bacterium]|nr:addiction module protein [Syntrophobacteraceae bacterium]
MVEETRKIVEKALKMPARERAEIAQRLLESLDRQRDIDVESAWQSEVERRISELDSGQVACIPWEEVRERLMRSSIEAG